MTTIIDIFLIYLACGSPLAVRQLVKKQAPLRVANVLGSAATLIYWPLLLPGIVRNRTAGDRLPNPRNSGVLDPDGVTTSSLAESRKSLEANWAQKFGETELSSFRHVLESYVGISLALGEVEDGLSTRFELFEISDHSDLDVANACLSRRFRQKLSTHQTLARNQFVEAVFELYRSGSTASLTAAVKLARCLGDLDCVAELNSLMVDSDVASAKAA
jgi:hypothetical protein